MLQCNGPFAKTRGSPREKKLAKAACRFEAFYTVNAGGMRPNLITTWGFLLKMAGIGTTLNASATPSVKRLSKRRASLSVRR